MLLATSSVMASLMNTTFWRVCAQARGEGVGEGGDQ